MADTPHRHRDYRAATSLSQESSVGALVGAIAGGLLAGAMDQSPIATLLGVAGCGVAGTVFGVLLWLDSAHLPEEAIPPVRKSTRTRDL